LLRDNGARDHAAATETRTTTPRLSAGLSTLVHPSAGDSESATASGLPRAVRAALLAGDAALIIGAVLLHNSRPADAITVALAAGAVLLGAWLGWLALTSHRPPS
jgi:hypothetical protein